MTGFNFNFSSLESYDGGTITFCDNKRKSKIVGMSTISVENLTMSNVYLVDGLNFNLLSISQLCVVGYHAKFDVDVCYLINTIPGLSGTISARSLRPTILLLLPSGSSLELSLLDPTRFPTRFATPAFLRASTTDRLYILRLPPWPFRRTFGTAWCKEAKAVGKWDGGWVFRRLLKWAEAEAEAVATITTARGKVFDCKGEEAKAKPSRST